MSETPLATNNLNSLGTFFHREQYKTSVYPTGSIPDPIDMWYERPLYGKVDHNNNSVFISEASLKQLKGGEEPLFAANFVVDAFEDFKKQFKRAEVSARLHPDSEFTDMKASLGWKNVNSIYHTYINLIYNNFANVFIQDNGRREKIRDFDSFFKVFIEYINVICPIFPFTRTAFIRSKYCSPTTSGFFIEVKEENHAVDKNKFERFIQDTNFDFYTKTARNFGFLVDKNAPWRLVADLASPAMKPYLDKYNLTDLNKIFKDLFYESFKSDIEVLKVYLVQFYNSLVVSEPYINLIKTSQIIKDESIAERIQRKPFTQQDINAKLNFAFWNKLYIYIRAKETSLIWSQAEFDRFVLTSNAVEKTIDTGAAREYINRRFSSLPDIQIDFEGKAINGAHFSFF